MLKNYTTSHKYFLYARKSTESEDKQMASIEDQITEMKRLAEKRGFQIVDIIKETKSAKEPGRPKFNEMLSRIHKGEANAILTWKLNRLARNPIDGGQISWMLQQHKIQEIATYASSYLPSDNVLLMQIEFGMATQYVKDLSASVNRGLRLKAERGWFPASHLPTGYVRNPNRKESLSNDIIADPKRFEIIKALWNEALTGKYSIADLQSKAIHLGLQTKSGKEYGNYFLYRLFKNEFYAGYFYWKNEEGEKIRYKGLHKPMVTTQEFKEVQTLLSSNQKYLKENEETFLFRGLLSCGQCARGITAERKLQCICSKCKYKFSCKTINQCPNCKMEIKQMNNPSIIDQTYYRCTNNKHKCTQKPINEKKLEKQFLAILNAISISKEFHKYALKKIDNLKLTSLNISRKKIKSLDTLIAQNQKKIKQLTELRINNEISSEEFAELKAELTDDNLKYKEELEKLIIQTSQQENEFKNYLNTSESILEKFNKGSFYIKRNIVSTISSNLKLLNKNLYFSMPKALFKVLLYAELYNADKEKLEPKKSLIYSQDLTVFTLPFSVGEQAERILEPKFNHLVEQFEKMCA